MNKVKNFIYLLLGLCISMTGCSLETESGIDYRSCLNKIWIVADKSIEESTKESFSFVITKIEHDYVEGQYTAAKNVVNPQKDLPGRFTGKIEGLEIQCQLWNEEDEVGNMVLSCTTDNRMKATIDYSGTDRELAFKVYNIEDLKPTNIILDQNRAITVDMDKWGTVQIICGIVYYGNRPPVAFMTNEQGDIFYEFQAEFANGTLIKEIEVLDFNEDGLKDVNIVTRDYDDEMEPVHWLFYQEEGVAFYLDNEEQSLAILEVSEIVPIKKGDKKICWI